jgi:hypothetical protein
MKSDITTFVFENEIAELTLELSSDGHLKTIMDFYKTMSLEEAMRFIDKCGYKIKKCPLRIIK